MAVRAGYLDSHFAYTGNDNNSFGFLPSAYFGGSNPDDPWGFQAPAQLSRQNAAEGREEHLPWLSTEHLLEEVARAAEDDFTAVLDVTRDGVLE